VILDFVDTREIDDGAKVRRSDEFAIDSAHQSDNLVLTSNLWAFALNVTRAQFADGFNFNSIDDRRVKLLTTTKSWAKRDPNDHARLILIGLIAQTNRGSFSSGTQNLFVEFGVKVECKHGS